MILLYNKVVDLMIIRLKIKENRKYSQVVHTAVRAGHEQILCFSMPPSAGQNQKHTNRTLNDKLLTLAPQV